MIESLEAQGLQLAKEKQEYLGECGRVTTIRLLASRTACHLNWLLHLCRQTDGGDRGAQSSAGPEGGGTLLLPVGFLIKRQHVARITGCASISCLHPS